MALFRKTRTVAALVSRDPGGHLGFLICGKSGEDKQAQWRNSAVLQSYRRSSSRPRGPLWRSRKGISKEALYAVMDVKRVKIDQGRVSNCLETTVARLLKEDLLAVLKELIRQGEVDIALQVFNMVQKEVWYKPDVYLYKDMLSCLSKNKRVVECERLLRVSKAEGIPPDSLILTEVMRAYLECGMLPQAMETFESMRKGSCPPDRPAFTILMRYLKKMNKKELRRKIRKEFLEFYEGIEPREPQKNFLGLYDGVEARQSRGLVIDSEDSDEFDDF